jgi:predicted nucleic acid-binding Zn ribbon protein
MERDDDPTPACALCGDPFWPEQAGQRYCSSRHRETARKRRQRSRSDREQLLVPLGTSLTELYTRATPPRPAVADDEHPDEDQADERGYADEGPGTWSDTWRLHEAVEAIQARYERLAQPYLAQLRRNPGVRPPALVQLEQQCAGEATALIRAHQHAADTDRAHRNEARRLNEAHERQMEQRALQALASDLSGGSRRYQPPEHHGRPTHDLWNW